MSFNKYKINYNYGNFTQINNDFFNTDLLITNRNYNLNYNINKNLNFTSINNINNIQQDDIRDFIEENE